MPFAGAFWLESDNAVEGRLQCGSSGCPGGWGEICESAAGTALTLLVLPLQKRKKLQK